MSAAVHARLAPAIYREEQNFSAWVYVVLFALCFLVVLGFRSQRGTFRIWIPPLRDLPSLRLPLMVLVGVILPSAISAFWLHMTTHVALGVCRVWYGWLPTWRRDIVLSLVDRVEVVEYSAIREHGFWGLRRSRGGELVMTAKGRRGVRLVMSDGTRVLIGSQRPEELASVLDRERRAVV